MRNPIHLSRLQRPVGALLLALVVFGGVARIASAVLAPSASPGPADTWTPPRSVLATEIAAEDVIRLALLGERAKVVATAAQLRASARAAAPQLAGAPPREVSLLLKRANRVVLLARRAPLLGVALAANEVSRVAALLYSDLGGGARADVVALGYLDREALLRSLAGDKSAARAAAREVDRLWTVLRPAVARRAARTADRYDAHVAAMERSALGTPRSLEREAVRGLALDRALAAAVAS